MTHLTGRSQQLRRWVVWSLASVLLLAGCSQGDSPTPSPAPSAVPAGMVSISLDDGTLGHLTYAQPVLVRLQLPATFYLVADALDYGPANLDVDQAKSLIAAGQEIGNHTKSHQDLTELPPAKMVTELAEAQATLVTRLGVTPTSCAYPYGAQNAAVVAEVTKLSLKGCRTTDGGANSETDLKPYQLATFLVTKKTTLADVRTAVEQAKADRSWVIFTFHGVDPKAETEMDVTPAAFTAAMEAIKASGVPVKTVGAALTTLGR